MRHHEECAGKEPRTAKPAVIAIRCTGDNGNVMGKYYEDNVNTGYSHTSTFTYGALNRLTQVTATGNWTENLTYSYDQYGNGTCVMNANTQGVCPQYSYNGATNQISNSGYTYDADGDLTYDGTHNYQYDAEGRISYASQGTWWEKTVYNALGKRVAVSYPDGSYTVTHIFPRDIFGHRTGIFDDRPSVGWEGWDQWWAQVAGVRLLMGGSTSQVLHTDAVGTTLMVTDQTGAASGDITYDPWGDRTGGGGSNGDAFGGLEYQVNQALPPSATRDYNPTMGRWMTPDPSGRKAVSLTNPQTWNMYAYADDNPTTLNDPSGLQSCDKLNGTGCNQPAGAVNGTGTAQKESKSRARARATEAGEAALNFTLAAAKIKIAAAVSTTAETGVGAIGAFYAGWSAAGNLAAGSFELVGALTGKTQGAEKAAEGASVATSALGLLTLVTTGSLNRAAGMAAVEGIVTSRPSDLAEGGTATRVAKATDLLQNIHRVEQKVENLF